MSRTVQVIASRVLLSITLIFALTQMHVFAQNYTWRNVQIVGGGFIVGVVFNQTEPRLHTHRHRRRLSPRQRDESLGAVARFDQLARLCRTHSGLHRSRGEWRHCELRKESRDLD
jgi:hypothetical protein